MKFQEGKPIIHINQFDYMMQDLKREFDKLLLLQATVNSYTTPCEQTKQRINKLNNCN
jgi:hypothetical protein